MECPRCQAEKALGAKYCGGCGRPVQLLSCQHCGTGNPPTSTFCHECGRALAGAPAIARDDRPEVPSPEDTEETRDSAFWEAYADRTGIPAAGLIEVAPRPEVARRESPVETRDRRSPPRRRRDRGLHATLQEDRERRPVRIVVAAGTILAVVLILLVLSTKSWRAVLGLERQESIVVPADRQTIASRPVPDLVPAPAAPAIPLAEDIPAEQIRVPSPPSRSGALDPPAEPSRTPTTPGTSVERMATFLVGRDGPERAIQTALAVAKFYPPNTDNFNYWHRVVAAIRASAASKDGRDQGQAIPR